MNKEGTVIVGLILLIVGAVLAWQSYVTVTQCNSPGGRVVTFISTLFGGQSAQTCSNAQILEISGIVVAVIGLVVAIFALYDKNQK
ncbi:MAG: hypothetical protein ABSD68_04000 [Candidatus Micrarchaeales archaeon]|jgi:hypothetical protein